MSLDINSNAWGYISDWTKSSGTTGDYFTYPWSRKDWSGLYSNGYQTIDEDIDLSIAPWRINKDSSLVDLTAAYYHNNWKEADSETISDPNERYQMHLQTWSPIIRKNVPFILSYWGQTGTTESPYWSKYWAYKVNGETKGNNITGNRYPVANFRYDKIRICPVIWLIDTNPENMSVNMPTRSQWGGFPTLEDIAAKPYCVGVGFEIFIDKSGTWTESPLTIDINTEFNGCNDSEIEEDWFSGMYGYSQMRMAYRYNPAGTHYNNMFFGYATSNAPDSPLWCHGLSKAFENAFSRSSFTQTSTYGYFPMNGLFDNVDFNEKTSTSSAATFTSTAYIELTADNYDDFKKSVMRELAYIGLPFTISRSLIATASASDENLYYPVFDSQRCTTGEYKTGEDAETLPNYGWRWIYELDPLPEDIEPVDPEEDSGYLNNKQTYFYRYANPNAVYALTYANFQNFANDVNNLYSNDPSNLQQMQIDFKGVNPQDYIIGVYGIPFNVNYVSPTAPDDDIKLGVLTLPTAKGKLVDTDTSLVRQLGHITIPKFYGDFRDFEPYTQIELYLPFCGTVKLDPAQVVGHDLYLYYYYDILTLSCTACIYRDDQTLIQTASGVIGASLPFTASAMGSYQNAMKQTENAIKRNEMSIGLGVASTVIGIAGIVGAPETGGASLALAGAAIAGMGTAYKGMQTANELQYELKHKQPQISQCSSPNGAVSQWIAKMIPICFIKRAKMLTSYNAESYGKTVGYACCINTTIGTMSGLTVCSNVDLSGLSATASEISAIQSLLTSGIYV